MRYELLRRQQERLRQSQHTSRPSLQQHTISQRTGFPHTTSDATQSGAHLGITAPIHMTGLSPEQHVPMLQQPIHNPNIAAITNSDTTATTQPSASVQSRPSTNSTRPRQSPSSPYTIPQRAALPSKSPLICARLPSGVCACVCVRVSIESIYTYRYQPSLKYM